MSMKTQYLLKRHFSRWYRTYHSSRIAGEVGVSSVAHATGVIGVVVLDGRLTVNIRPQTTHDDVVHGDCHLGPCEVLTVLEHEVGTA